MKVLVTGAAGFIGAAVVKSLLNKGCTVVGLDNINSYYDTGLKYARLADSGIAQGEIRENNPVVSTICAEYSFVKMELTDRMGLDKLFASQKFDIVINLAGQAGVRYSIENPFAYVDSNVVGFLNILENCRHYPVKHLLYASSSSVYGMGEHFPYSEADITDAPVSLYAATKKSNELMAYAYSTLFGVPATGMRFFTVYGPWGRPDMAPFLFLDAVMKGKPIRVFNNGNMLRDFTYIDDIVGAIISIMDNPPTKAVPHDVYNIGRSNPVALMDFIHTIEEVAGKTAVMKMTEMQKGDVYCTYADTTRLQQRFGYSPAVSIKEGIEKFYEWYKAYMTAS